MNRTGSVALTLMLASSLSFAHGDEQPYTASLGSPSVPSTLVKATGPQLTGNLRVDFFGQKDLAMGLHLEEQMEGEEPRPHKSPWLAAGLSLVLPGSGEFYAENYWRSAAFFVLEVAAWTVAYKYDKKGDRQTDFFQNFANGHWSVVQYAQYAQSTLAPAGQTYNWLIPGTEGRPPWERVYWPELNRMERAISSTAPGQYYSHTLPSYGEQQYYELIGKYPQFNQGWDDAPPTFNYGDPVTTNDIYYEKERAHADDFYNTASTMVSIAVVNHVLSAVDAALSATSFNRVHASVGLQKVSNGARYGRVPTVKLSYSF
jgi:hypothetical protein